MDTVLVVVLVLVTGCYAWQIHTLAVAMQRDRAADYQARRQARAEDAAMRALLALRSPSRLHAGELLPRAVCRELHATLGAEVALLEDAVVRDRVRAASIVALTAAAEEELRDDDRELAMLHARLLFEATRHTLECYLTGGFLPDWGPLPSATAAQNWLLASARGGELPATH